MHTWNLCLHAGWHYTELQAEQLLLSRYLSELGCKHVLLRWGCLWAQCPESSLRSWGDSQVTPLVGGNCTWAFEVGVWSSATPALVVLRGLRAFRKSCPSSWNKSSRKTCSLLIKFLLLKLPTTLYICLFVFWLNYKNFPCLTEEPSNIRYLLVQMLAGED